MPELTDKERIAQLEQELASRTKDLEAAEQKVESFEESRKRSTNRKLFAAEKITKHFLLGPKLKGSLVKLMNGDTSKDNIADVLTAGLYRFTRIGIFAVLVAIIPLAILTIQTVLLNRQNDLLRTQNDKIERQNFRLDQQTALLEADRRSAVILESGNVLDAVSKELERENNRKNRLSSALLGRIIALSRTMKPYKYLDPDNDTIMSSSISPERGHLLVSLQVSNIDSVSLIVINEGADFSKADLRGANLVQANLRQADLRGANFSYANLVEADLRFADLREANLQSIDLPNPDVLRAFESSLDMRDLIIFPGYHNESIGPCLRGADLRKADLRNAYLRKADMREALLCEANLIDAYLGKADLRRTDLCDANFDGAYLRGANFDGAYLRGANFANTSVDDANFRGAYASRSDVDSFMSLNIDTTGIIWLDE